MKVYAAEFNDCTHESAFGIISLHSNKEDAITIVHKKLKEEMDEYDRMKLDFPDWIRTRVTEYEVL